MFGDDKNLRDNSQKPIKDNVSGTVLYKGQEVVFESYPKLNKLITALYIVTDIIEKDEPVRLKLRTLGVEILSDINSVSRTEINKKTKSILSFLDIARAINLISEMNFNILKKEFTLFSQTLEETQKTNHVWLEEFLKPDEALAQKAPEVKPTIENNKNFSFSTKIEIPNNRENTIATDSSFMLKKQRREDISQAIKTLGGGATIAEVKTKAGVSLSTFSEKTLQRELVSMVKDGLLTKTGEKRWSKYSLKNS